MRAGMVLAKDVHTFRNQLLLPAGTALTEKHIEQFKAWGVPEADIEGHGDVTLEDLNAQIKSDPRLLAASAALDHRFAKVKDDELMQEILKIAKKQLLAGPT
jgi:hypothetical protein